MSNKPEENSFYYYADETKIADENFAKVTQKAKAKEDMFNTITGFLVPFLAIVFGVSYVVMGPIFMLNPVDMTIKTYDHYTPYLTHWALSSFLVFPLVYIYMGMKNYTISLKTKLLLPVITVTTVLLVAWLRFDGAVMAIYDSKVKQFLNSESSKNTYIVYSRDPSKMKNEYEARFMVEYEMLTYAKEQGINSKLSWNAFYNAKFEGMDDDVKQKWLKKRDEVKNHWLAAKLKTDDQIQKEAIAKNNKFYEDLRAKERQQRLESQKIDLNKEMATFKKEMTQGMNPENPVRQVIEGVGVENGRVTYNGAGLTPQTQAQQDLDKTKKEFE